MNYTIHQLQVFLKVVEMESVTKASEELFMTQPAVSIQLKKFQEQFSIPLTEVIGRKLYITDFGREVAVIAQRVLDEVEQIRFKTKEYEGVLRGRLKIASASTGKYVAPFFLTGFLDQHSGIDLKLDVTNKARVLESLQNNEVDFALVSIVPEGGQFNEEKLLDNKLYLIGNASDNMTPDSPLIYREKGSATRTEMESYFGMNPQLSRKKIELTSNEAVKQAVLAGIGYSILPLIGIMHELKNGDLKVIEVEGLPLETQWRLIWLKDKKLSPVAKAYLQYIRADKDEILKEHFEWYMNFSGTH